MWFKNLRVYRLTERIKQSPESIHEDLSKFTFKPCGSLDPVKYGWTPPLGREGSQLVHAANGYIMICAKRQEKVIPSAVINEALEERIAEISAAEARHVGRNERQQLKDDVIFSLMPKALAKSSYDYAYIDTHDQYIVVNTSSTTRAEEMLSALREALGSLKIIPFTPLKPSRTVLTKWILNSPPKDIVVGEECELSSEKEDRIIRCKHQDLNAAEVQLHLESGLQVSKLAIKWKDAIECIIDEQACFKRLKYDDAIYEKVDDHNIESKAEQFDIEFSVMTLEISAFLRTMSKIFGGIKTELPK